MTGVMEGKQKPRILEKHWNVGLLAASITISLLGAFTSTQLMCHARTSRYFSSVLVWAALASLTFGFSSIWSLHEVAMLACELDLPIGIDVPLSILSAGLAVIFTFAALTSDLLWESYIGARRSKRSMRKERRPQGASANRSGPSVREEDSSEPLLDPFQHDNEEGSEYRPDLEIQTPSHSERLPAEEEEGVLSNVVDGSDWPFQRKSSLTDETGQPPLFHSIRDQSFPQTPVKDLAHTIDVRTERSDDTDSETWTTASLQQTLRNRHISRRSSSVKDSASSSFGLGNIISARRYQRSSSSTKGALVAIGLIIYTGITQRNVLKGFLWSLAITGMHYVGISALHIPKGYMTFNPFLVFLSGLICWIVCLIGCILIPQIEVHLPQQFLFSAVATAGVAGMHFTGMRAATFWSYQPPSESRGYPPALAIAIGSIAVTTCIMANALLAHSTTVSRNKLAEIVTTKKKLWMTIAQKKNAEAAAAARSDFIASASHEIRTPLHHLQGYSDLLSQTELSEEGRFLLHAIQRATKTLSLSTSINLE